MPPIPEGCSPMLQDFLEQCFHKDPSKRPSAEFLCEHPWLKKEWGALKASFQTLSIFRGINTKGFRISDRKTVFHSSAGSVQICRGLIWCGSYPSRIFLNHRPQANSRETIPQIRHRFHPYRLSEGESRVLPYAHPPWTLNILQVNITLLKPHSANVSRVHQLV